MVGMAADDWIATLEAEVAQQLGQRQTWDTPADLAYALDSGYRIRAHLKHLSDRLAEAVKDVENGKSRYMLVSMPPRLGKSHLTSIHLPLWVLATHPSWKVMLLSHSPNLAAGWGKAVRRGVENNPQLGLQIAPDAGAAMDWEVERAGQENLGVAGRGAVVSRSIRQSVTGLGAKVMILDDVVKDIADAHSKNARDFVWDWWTFNSRTRLEEPALVVVIGTRWHEDDIIGRLRSDEYDGDPDQWEVISFPALAEHDDVLGREIGEPLLSPLSDETPDGALIRWADIKRAVGSYAWAALYQQRPAPAEGAIFVNDWWRFWRLHPSSNEEDSTIGLPRDDDGNISWDRALTSWDCAFKGTDSSDYVVGQLWGISGANRYLLKQVRARLSFTETLPVIREFIASAEDLVPGGVHEHLVEDKANGTAVIDVLKTEIPGMIPVNPTDSKEARARSVTPDVEAGNVILPASAEWLMDYLAEMRSFPNGAHDDQVDCTVQVLQRVRSGGNVVTLVPTATINRGYARGVGGGRPGMSSGTSVGRRRG